MFSHSPGPIGIFDSGYGGLTILHGIRQRLPEYDYMYLGDNARAPYGSRSFEVVYQFTRQAVLKLFDMGCQLVILGCNTASAKALRSIQQRDLPEWDPDRRVLGIIRPTAEVIGNLTTSRHVGLLATPGTILSGSYELEIAKLFPDIRLSGVGCPLWASIVEAGEADSPGADYFVKKRIDMLLRKDPDIDAIILGCTHYPLLKKMIGDFVGDSVTLIDPGKLTAIATATALDDLGISSGRSTGGTTRFFVSDTPDGFAKQERLFMGSEAGGPVEQIAIETY